MSLVPQGIAAMNETPPVYLNPLYLLTDLLSYLETMRTIVRFFFSFLFFSSSLRLLYGTLLLLLSSVNRHVSPASLGLRLPTPLIDCLSDPPSWSRRTALGLTP